MKLAENQKNFYYEIMYKFTSTIRTYIFNNMHEYRKRKEVNTIFSSLNYIESFLLNRVEETVNAKFWYTDKKKN